MWGGTNYGEALRYLKDTVRDEEAFVEEVQNVTQHLRNGESYFRVNHNTDRRMLSGDEQISAIGIAAHGNGYVFARKESRPFDDPDTEYFGFMRFERPQTSHKPFLHTTAYAESLKYDTDELPDSHYAHSRADLYYRLLKEVSPHPDEDIRIIKPDYVPSHPARRVEQR